jgi:hypothetical protein
MAIADLEGPDPTRLGVTMPDEAKTARGAAAWVFAITGLAAYNWWLLVPFVPGLMRSPSEIFSNLEVSGQPYAAVMQHADLTAGLLLAAAFALAGSRSMPAGRREWMAMMVFAIAAALGGIFPEACADEVSASCWHREWTFQLPLSQYLHIVVGVIEFGAITLALVLAFRRTRDRRGGPALVYRVLLKGSLAAYLLLGLAYLLNRLGGIMEPVFFVGFTIVAVTQLAERTGGSRDRTARPSVLASAGNPTVGQLRPGRAATGQAGRGSARRTGRARPPDRWR